MKIIMSEEEFIEQLNVDYESQYPAWFFIDRKVIGFKIGEKIEMEIVKTKKET